MITKLSLNYQKKVVTPNKIMPIYELINLVNIPNKIGFSRKNHMGAISV